MISEQNDGLYWVQKHYRPGRKDKFGIVGIQVAGSMLNLSFSLEMRMICGDIVNFTGMFL